MKKIIYSVLMSLTAIGSFAQNNIDYYEYWFDSNVAGKVTQSITPATQFQLNTALPTTGLTNGLHTVHIRFRDENNRFSSVLSAFFLKNGTNTAASNQISAYEYWFDQNYAGRIAGTLPAAQWVNFSTLAPTAGLSAGLHTAHIRFRDANGQWGSVLSQFFLKQETTIPPNTPALTEYEYWFNSDFTNAQQVTLGGNATEQVIAAIDANSLQSGLNTFHLRFKDANGQWGSVLSQFFIKSTNTLVSSNQMTAYEYWFDADYANRVNTSIAGNPVAAISGNLDASSLPVGLHTIHIRFQDATDQWSSVLSNFFVKNAPTNGLTNTIQAYRYWFDGNSTSMVNMNLSNPQQYVSVSDPVSMVQIPKGTHTIHFQFQDTQGLWSSVTTDTIYKNSLPIAQFSADTTQFCDAGSVQFSNSSIDGEEYLWDFGDGQTSTDSIPLHTYAAPGNYSVSLTTTDLTAGLDSTLIQTQLVHVYATPDATIQLSGNDTICFGSSITLSSATPTANFLWSDGSSNPTLDVNTAGEYWVDVINTDFTACADHSDTIEIFVAPLPDASFTFSNVDHLVTFTNTSPVSDSYFWDFGDGATSTAIDPVHDYSVNGLYNAYLVATNFCGTDTAFASIDLQFIGLGENLMTERLYLYPNPTNGPATLGVPLVTESEFNLAIYSEKGELVQVQNHVNSSVIQLDLSNFQNGTYFIHVTSTNGWTGIQKIVLNR